MSSTLFCAAFVAAYFLLGDLLHRWNRRLHEGLLKGEQVSHARTLQALWYAYFFLPWPAAAYLIWADVSGSRARLSIRAFELQFLLPVGLVLYYVLRREAGAFFQKATAVERRFLLYNRIILVCTLTLVPYVVAAIASARWGNALPGMVIVLGMVLFALWRRGGVAGLQKSKSAEMEPTPLKSDILKIAQSFGWVPVEVYFLSLRQANGKPPVSRAEWMGCFINSTRQFNPAKPAIPLPLLQKLESDAVCAGVALMYSRARSGIIGRSRIASFMSGPIGSALLWLVIFFGFVFAFATGLPLHPNAFLFLSLLIPVAIVGSLIRHWLKRIYSIGNAFIAWLNIGFEDSSPERFICALAEHQFITGCHDNVEYLVAAYKSSRPVRKFLAAHEIMDQEPVWAQMRKCLSAMSPLVDETQKQSAESLGVTAQL